MILKCSRDSQACMYDFASVGGLIGTYRLGLYIDAFSALTTFLMNPLIGFASGGLATISIGYIDSTGASVPAAFVAPTAFNSPLVWLSPGGQAISPAYEITFSIGVADLTAGRLIILTEYFNTDL